MLKPLSIFVLFTSVMLPAYGASQPAITTSQTIQSPPTTINTPIHTTAVSGKILNDLGEPVSGATVSTDGNTKTSAADGTYAINVRTGNTFTVTHPDYKKYTTEQFTTPDAHPNTDIKLTPNARESKRRECAAKNPPQDIKQNLLRQWVCTDTQETRDARDAAKAQNKALGQYIDDMEKIQRDLENRIKKLVESGDTK